jgi:hypothetical protein
VKNDRYHRKQKQQVNKKSRSVEDDETADPGEEKYQRNDKKHRNLFPDRNTSSGCIWDDGSEKGFACRYKDFVRAQNE